MTVQYVLLCDYLVLYFSFFTSQSEVHRKPDICPVIIRGIETCSKTSKCLVSVFGHSNFFFLDH